MKGTHETFAFRGPGQAREHLPTVSPVDALNLTVQSHFFDFRNRDVMMRVRKFNAVCRPSRSNSLDSNPQR